MGRLDNKVAIITGAGSGFGRATSILFAKEGAKVVVADWIAKGGEETVRMIKEDGGEAIFIKIDVSKTEDVRKMIKTTIDTYGKLDILHNNAGVVGQLAPLHQITEEQWNRVISINLTGVWLGMKYAIPEMVKKGGGTIINTASVGGIIRVPNTPTDYHVSKAGVIMLTKVAAVEFANRNIRVNCICPSHSLTPLVENAVRGNKEAINEFNQRAPMGRMATPEEIAQAALFLASEESSSFITGEALVVDGGYTVAGRGKQVVIR